MAGYAVSRLAIRPVLFLALALLSSCAALNRSVIDELTSSPQGDRAQRLLLLTLSDGREIPLRYLQLQQDVYVGAGGRWWRQFQTPVQTHMLLRGQRVLVTASAVLDDAALHRRVFGELRNPWLARLPRWLGGGVLVQLKPLTR